MWERADMLLNSINLHGNRSGHVLLALIAQLGRNVLQGGPLRPKSMIYSVTLVPIGV